MFEQEKDIALKAIRQAAALCQSVQAAISPEVMEKKDRSPVTVADFGSQALICKLLEERFPDDPIIGEEDAADLKKKENSQLLSKLTQYVQNTLKDATSVDICNWIDRGGAGEYSDRFWTLDPIDGTKGFLRKEQYAVSLALIVKGEIVLGALACPNLAIDPTNPSEIGAAFIAVKGEGAYQVSLKENGKPTRLNVSSQTDPTQIRFCESVEKAHSSHGDAARIATDLQIATKPVRLDSQTKYAVVARGEAEAYLRLPRDKVYREKIWDHAGGVLVVTEAGGLVTDITGKPLDFTCGRTLAQNRGIIVSNTHIHDNILNTINKLKIMTQLED